ncbi:hypothetical protein [Arthrobacter sp. KNU40]|uniref:hypothetical protein n=1 Tax=Arthrobacter sp. KNU40 TaxID=3447965 RepID=UPI003F64301D
MNNSTNTEEFAKDYIDAWGTKDDAVRRELVAKVYAGDAAFHADEPGDGPVEYHGTADIEANITRVNQRLVQDKGLITESTGFVANHDALRVSWRMITPNGNVAMTGMNMLLRNATGKISHDYIFIG